MGLVCQALQPEYCFSIIANGREVFIRTLIALSQAAFSSELNDLHSLRTCGEPQSHKATTADQRTTRATERIEGTSIDGRLGMRRGTYLRVYLWTLLGSINCSHVMYLTGTDTGPTVKKPTSGNENHI